MNGARLFTGSWRQFKGELKKHWAQLSDCDLRGSRGRLRRIPPSYFKNAMASKKRISSTGQRIGASGVDGGNNR